MDDFLSFAAGLEGYIQEFGPTFTQFLDLPPELRTMVYEEYFRGQMEWARRMQEERGSDMDWDENWAWPGMILQPDWRVQFTSPAFPSYLPKLCFTSHQMRNEVTKLILAKANT